MCGGAGPRGALSDCEAGPSPRVRGSPGVDEFARHVERSIPACAGEPSRASAPDSRARVHPRVCGGALHALAQQHGAGGPSPRVRGSLRLGDRLRLHVGSIPACAGEPSASRTTSGRLRVHPRGCGGASRLGRLAADRAGPSPRVRGSQTLALLTDPSPGSIPACAGEPCPSVLRRAAEKVHPRVCGGACRSGFA